MGEDPEATGGAGAGLPADQPDTEPPALPLDAGPGQLTPAVGAAVEHTAVFDPAAGPRVLWELRDGLRDWLRALSVPEPQLTEVLLAVGEACANVIEHSGARARDNQPPAGRLRAQLHERTLRVLVSDRGQWKPPSTDTGRGRGRKMMTALVDWVDIDTGPEGTTVELVKRLPAEIWPGPGPQPDASSSPG